MRHSIGDDTTRRRHPSSGRGHTALTLLLLLLHPRDSRRQHHGPLPAAAGSQVHPTTQRVPLEREANATEIASDIETPSPNPPLAFSFARAGDSHLRDPVENRQCVPAHRHPLRRLLQHACLCCRSFVESSSHSNRFNTPQLSSGLESRHMQLNRRIHHIPGAPDTACVYPGRLHRRPLQHLQPHLSLQPSTNPVSLPGGHWWLSFD